MTTDTVDNYKRWSINFPMWKTKHGDVYADSIPFFLIHIAGLVGVFFVPFSWNMVWLCLGLYFARIFFITGFYHRYFSHKGFKVRGRVTQFIMGFLGTTATQRGPLWWAAHHRHHHRTSDTEKDLHSPVQDGFWYSHVGWMLMGKNDDTDLKKIPDLAKYPELQWLGRHHTLAPILLSVALYYFGGWSALIWGMGLSQVMVWHGTFMINSLTHVFGVKKFQAPDESRNNWLFALLLLGEGWHNNHHFYQGGAKSGFRWYEIDITYYILKLISFTGLFYDVEGPPKKVLEIRRENDKARRVVKKYIRGNILKRLQVEEIGLLYQAIQDKNLLGESASRWEPGNLKKLTAGELHKLAARVKENLNRVIPRTEGKVATA